MWLREEKEKRRLLRKGESGEGKMEVRGRIQRKRDRGE